MTSTTQTPQPFDAASGLAPLRAKRGWIVALGIVYLIAGLIALGSVVTLLLGVSLIASGIMRIALAFNMKEGTPWIWVVLSGGITLLLGLIILAHWPVSSLYILGLFLGIDLVFAGAGWIAVGFGLGRRA
jgi:uncharacterized membrane protein HdeD (DUF308 family)